MTKDIHQGYLISNINCYISMTETKLKLETKKNKMRVQKRFFKRKYFDFKRKENLFVATTKVTVVVLWCGY